MSRPEGALAIVLHAHLPLVRHPENPYHLEELWFFEAMADCYLPLLAVLERLEQNDIPGTLTLSISPPLLTMMDDELLRNRFQDYLKRRIQLCRQEFKRTVEQPTFHRLSGWYLGLFEDLLEQFQDKYNRDLASAFAKHAQDGRLELITCAGSHAILPLLRRDSTRHAHIDLSLDLFAERFGCYPEGIWLPECAFEAGIENLLARRGIRYTIVESHATHPPSFPEHPVSSTPLGSSDGLAFFARDEESSAQVWSASIGYPGDFEYREFYRDIGFELDLEDLKPFAHPNGIRLNTGLKYYRITQPGEPKLPYQPNQALQKADQHAAHFASERGVQLERLVKHGDSPPLIVCAYDAELFGHWWFEGPAFLERFIEHAASTGLTLTTPGKYLDANPVLPIGVPATSSWGYNGYFEAWLNPDRNAWIHRYLHNAEERFSSILEPRGPNLSGQEREAMNQAARELLLAQSSDWSFIVNTGTAVEYAVGRLQDHLAAMHRLLDMVVKRDISWSYVQSRRERWGLFPSLDVKVFMDT